MSEVSKVLGRSFAAIKARADRHGIRVHKFTPKLGRSGVLKVGALYPVTSVSDLAKMFGRTPKAIRELVLRNFPMLVAAHNQRFPADTINKAVAPRCSDIWREEDDKILSDLWDAGRSAQDIAGQLGRTKGAVYNRAKKIHKQPRLIALPLDRIRQDYDAGPHWQNLRIAHTSAATLKDNLVVPTRTFMRISPEEAEIIHEKYLSGCTLECIAHGLGRQRAAIIHHIKADQLEAVASESFVEIFELVDLLVKEGVTTRGIAEKLKLPLHRAARIVGIVRVRPQSSL